jgi:hypothetical protein
MEMLRGDDPRVLSESTTTDKFIVQQLRGLADCFNQHVENDNERDESYKTSLIFLAAKLDILEHTVRELTSKLENQEGD